jgi:hypothetical protein
LKYRGPFSDLEFIERNQFLYLNSKHLSMNVSDLLIRFEINLIITQILSQFLNFDISFLNFHSFSFSLFVKGPLPKFYYFFEFFCREFTLFLNHVFFTLCNHIQHARAYFLKNWGFSLNIKLINLSKLRHWLCFSLSFLTKMRIKIKFIMDRVVYCVLWFHVWLISCFILFLWLFIN